MIRIELIPLEGIYIESIGRVELGRSKDEVERIIGKADREDGQRWVYDHYEFRLDFDKNNQLEFIEFIYGPFLERTQPEIFGIKPFETEAIKLVNLLTERNNGYVDLSEANHAFAFHEISVGIWRDATEADIEQMISEMKEHGEFDVAQKKIKNELEMAKYFWTIGLGVKNYYK
ncbi:hypothetical protein [Xanthocytophaga agilis]|uniref:Uncharacterized protein n=1 Tax=Xanthocytophaga agilis TaxID=3048010 RepID=A0AAE3UBA4_9BACT|nr:hypothetical protein [Xanthocytophaga agilis]MDJ1499603.1 hypothetical protein [Xanthocytophaga agilis]